MPVKVTNVDIASFVKHDQVYGAFKLAHVYDGNVSIPEYENVNGEAKVKRDSDKNIIRKTVPGWRLYLQYRTVGKQWRGAVECEPITDENTGEVTEAIKCSNGIITIELAKPATDEIKSNSRIGKLLVLLGVAESDAVDSTPDDLTDAADDTLSDDDLADDNTDDCEQTATIEEITEALLANVGTKFKAPFSKSARGYIIVSNDFDKWELV
jgi:hypothetical protein